MAITMIINNGKISVTCSTKKIITISSQLERLNIMMEKALPVILNQHTDKMQKKIKKKILGMVINTIFVVY